MCESTIKFKEEVEKSQLFKEIIYINSLGDYINEINKLMRSYYQKSDLKIREDFYFRGFSNLNQMQPTILRNHSIKNKEFEYIYKFEQNACLKLGQFNNPIDLAAAAQHYTVKTRLLDWTKSPLIATLFALYGNDVYNDYYGVAFKNSRDVLTLKALPMNMIFDDCLQLFDDGMTMTGKYVVMIDNYKKALNVRESISIKTRNTISNKSNDEYFDCYSKIIDEHDKKNINVLFEFFKSIVYNTNIGLNDESMKDKAIFLLRKFLQSNNSIFLETNYSNERLRSQRGVFEIVDIDNLTKKVSNTSVLLINKKARMEIIKYINKLGINYYMINDDPENCSKTLNRTIEGELLFDKKIEY